MTKRVGNVNDRLKRADAKLQIAVSEHSMTIWEEALRWATEMVGRAETIQEAMDSINPDYVEDER